jgi:hypothetical protein
MSPGDGDTEWPLAGYHKSGRHARDAHRSFLTSGGRKAWLDHQFAVPSSKQRLVRELVPIRRWEHAPMGWGAARLCFQMGRATPHCRLKKGWRVGTAKTTCQSRIKLAKLTANDTRMGLTLLVVPVPLQRLPIGVQIIAPPRRDEVALPIAYSLEKVGPASAAAARVGETSKFVDEPASLVAATEVGQLPCSRCCGRR